MATSGSKRARIALLVVVNAAGCGGADPPAVDAATADAVVDTVDAAPSIDAGPPTGTPLATGLHRPAGVAVTAGHVYFVTTGDPGSASGVVARVSIGGGATETLVAGQSHPFDLRVADRAYWTNSDFLAADGSSLRSIALAGGATIGLASTDPGPRALAIDATTAFFAVGGGDHRLLAVPLAGGATRAIATASIAALDVEVDNAFVYYLDANAGGGRVMRVDKTGALPPEELSRALVSAGRLTSDGGALYWTSGTAIMRASKDGSDPRTLATAAVALGAIAVDATDVYVAELDGGLHDARILRVAVNGGALEVVTAPRYAPAAIALDDTSVYWSDTGALPDGGEILRIGK
jgi:hypothetical protein